MGVPQKLGKYMRLVHIGSVLGVLLLTGVGVLYWQNLSEDAPAAPGVLVKTINQCDLIAGKAAAALPEALPFQQQEKIARQSHVLERCMQDRGYQENPAWKAQASTQARQIALVRHISEEEAYEALRRQAMLKSETSGISYWRQRSR